MDDKRAGRFSVDFPIRKFNSRPRLQREAERWISTCWHMVFLEVL